MASTAPLVVVLAGPNGAGKSTTAPRVLRDALAVEEFVNADAIAAGLSAFHPDAVAFQAGRIMLERIRALGAARASFAFETTLASRTFAPRLAALRNAGYRTHLVFLSLPNPELAIARVAARVRMGGHHVPDDVVRRRFRAGLRNLLELYDDVVDSWQLFDSSDSTSSRLVASRKRGDRLVVADSRYWRSLTGDARMTDLREGSPDTTDPTEDLPRILRAIQMGVREALLRHKQAGNSVPVWRDNRIVWLTPDEIPPLDALDAPTEPDASLNA